MLVDVSQEIMLANLYAVMSQNRIGGSDMKIDIGQNKVVQIGSTCESDRFVVHWQCDSSNLGTVYLFGVARFKQCDGLIESRYEFWKGRLIVFVLRWLQPSKT